MGDGPKAPGGKLRRARLAAGLTQGEVRARLAKARRQRGRMPPKDASLKRMYTAWESGKVRPTDWREELCDVFGLTASALGLDAIEPPTPRPTLTVHATPQLLVGGYDYGDSEYVEAVRGYITSLVSLDNRFGGADLVRVAVRFFGSVHNLIGAGAYDQKLERDLNAAAGELAEVVGWLAYDAEQHDLVRRMNQESLYFSRLAGDRSIELLTLQNSSMHAGAMGRPGEALQLARSVLHGNGSLSPRLRALFLTRKARALAQMGDEKSLVAFREVRSLFLDGVTDQDPAWTWWIDERELAWHEAMARRDLQNSSSAIAEFEHAVEATATSETRSQYLHRAYLLQAQVEVGSWTEAAATTRSIIPLVHQVASTRTVVILRDIIEKVTNLPAVPDEVQNGMAKLGATLDASPL